MCCSEAEENAEADKRLREKVEAKNALESYLYSIKTTIITDSLKDKINADDKEIALKSISDAQTWLEAHADEDTESYNSKRKEVESVVGPMIAKAYQSSEGQPSASESTSSSEDSSDTQSPGDFGPTVEEVD